MTFTRLLLAVLLLLIAQRSMAQPAADVAPAAVADAAQTALAAEAPVVVFNRTVAVFRAPYLGVPPERRARRTEAILREPDVAYVPWWPWSPLSWALKRLPLRWVVKLF